MKRDAELKDGVALTAPNEAQAPDCHRGLDDADGVDERAVAVAGIAALLMLNSVNFRSPRQLVRMANQLLEEAKNPQHLLDVREVMRRHDYTEHADCWV